MLLRTERATGVILRLFLAVLAFGGLALYFEEALVRLALPVFNAWIGFIDDTYRTMDLHLEQRTGEWMMVRIASPAVVHVLGGHVISADPRTLISTSASAGIVLQPLVLAGALLCAWPARTAVELALRVLLALPLLVLVVLLDVPLMLYGFIWNQEIMALEPERFSPLATWADFMNAGGRFASTVVAVAGAVFFARVLTGSRSEMREGSQPSRVAVEPPAVALPKAPPSP